MADEINRHHPPKWACNFLRWFCREDLSDAIEGDLTELFERRAKKHGAQWASFLFVLNVLMFFQPFAFKKRSGSKKPGFLEMQILNLNYALRNLAKSRSYSLINVLSLSIGLTASGLLAAFVAEELSYDKYHRYGERTYRLGYQLENANQPTRRLAWVSALAGPAVGETYPEVESVVRIRNCGGTMIAPNQEVFLEEGGFFAEASFFDVFSFKPLSGNLSGALDEPYELVLTQSMARKYFGEKDPIGQTMELRVRDTLNLTVTAVIEDVPAESHFTFDYLISHITREQLYPHIQGWFSLGTHTYFRLRESADPEAFEKKIENLVMDHNGEEISKIGFTIKLFIQPLWNIHLRSDLGSEITTNGSLQYVKMAIGVLLIIFFISAFNFINLCFARSVKFVQQIGIRQIMGANRSQLIHQFMTETVLLVVISFSLSVGLVYVLFPYFEQLVKRNLTMEWTGIFSMSTIGLIVLGVGVLAGLLPTARILSMQAINNLKGKFGLVRKKHSMGQLMIVVQFTMATLLICSVLVINGQLNYMMNSSLGFEREQVAVIDLWNNRQARQNTSILKTELLQSPNISLVSASNSVPGEQLLNRVGYPGRDEANSKVMFSLLIQEDFLELYDLKLIAGKEPFSPDLADQENAYLINEKAASEFGWTPGQAIGQDFQWGSRSGHIVGVVKDFHYYSLHEQVPPMIILPTERGVGYLSVKMNGPIRETVDFMADAWETFYPSNVFELTFLDEKFNEQYQLENQLSRLMILFTAIAILLAGSGLFSLSTFHVEQRIKEIGIRKLLGASVPDICYLIGIYFLQWVGLAVLLALPLTYQLARDWLDEFAFRMELSPLFFVFAAAIAVLIALLTVSVQTIRAAYLNPVDNLRYE